MSPARKVKIVKKRTTPFPRFQADRFKRMNVSLFLAVEGLFVIASLEKAKGY